MRLTPIWWGMAALGAILLAFGAWEAIHFLQSENSLAQSGQRDITHPIPIEIALATLPLFRSGNLLATGTVTSTQRFARSQEIAPSSSSSASTVLSAWIMGLTTDGHSLFMATEDRGVWSVPLGTKSGESASAYTIADGLGDNHIYAVACDKLGRIWAGHLNHGVSVGVPTSNGMRWQNYNVLDGALGERIFAIKINPADGDVWIATSRGLTRYSMKQDTWTYYTRADGLPSNQIQAMAFAKDGTLYAGTQCDGLTICTPERSTSNAQVSTSNQRIEPDEGRLEYKTWRVVPGAKQMPMLPSGEGLPSNLINDVLVARDGTIWVATTTGLAWTKDKGQAWKYVRGRDWAAKVKSRYDTLPGGWMDTPGGILAEDYVTCLAEDPSTGRLYVGYRQEGCGTFDPASMQAVPIVTGLYASSILCLPNRVTLLGAYGDGLVDLQGRKEVRLGKVTSGTMEPLKRAQPTIVSGLPSPAKSPTLSELNAMLTEIDTVKPVPEDKQPMVVALDDDWKTQGDWLGRYGRYWACLADFCHPYDYLWGAGERKFSFFARIGPNHAPDDVLRAWTHALKTDDARCLEMPAVYLESEIKQGRAAWDQPRRAAQWDDHGEGYPMTMDGPHVYCSLWVPPGTFYLSLYAVNLDGNVSRNRYRDFRISLRPHNPRQPLIEVAGFREQPELAHSRVRDFYCGVWKCFLTHGPALLTIEVNRNYSFNTDVQAVMLDLVDEDPAPYFRTVEEWQALSAVRRRELVSASLKGFHPCSSEFEAVEELVESLRRVQMIDPEWWAANRGKYYSLLGRWFQEHPETGAHMATTFYNLDLFAQWEDQQRLQGMAPARDIEKALQWDGDTSTSDRGCEYVTAYLLNRNRISRPDTAQGAQSRERR